MLSGSETIHPVEILLVEDSPLDAELTIRALTKAGLANNLLWVKDGQEALDYMFRQGEYSGREQSVPRLVLLDLNMPKVGGIEVLKSIKSNESTRHVPVVVMTSSQEEQDLHHSYGLGVNSYVVKPMDFNSMSEVVRQAGYYWLVVNKAR